MTFTTGSKVVIPARRGTLAVRLTAEAVSGSNGYTVLVGYRVRRDNPDVTFGQRNVYVVRTDSIKALP